MGKRHGVRIIIGGREDVAGKKIILTEVARLVGHGKLVVTTVASERPEASYEAYAKAFGDLGVKEVAWLEIREREQANSEESRRIMEGASGVFFTGGDQLRITTRIGGTAMSDAVLAILRRGGVVAGTSAGAAVMSETMVISGGGCASYRIAETVAMAPGLGLVRGVIVDQHFAERGRMGRLLGAVAHNPGNIGLGIDEDTAVIIEGPGPMRIIGSGAAYILDCANISHSNIAEECGDLRIMSVFDVKIHVLSNGDAYDIESRKPIQAPREEEKKRTAEEQPKEGEQP